MKRILGIVIVTALLLGAIGCASVSQWDVGKYLGSIEVMAVEYANATQVSGNIMAVFYTRADERIVLWCADAQIIDNGDGTWDVVSNIGYSATGVSQDMVAYGLYQYQDLSIDMMAPPYLDDLGLVPITWQDLPRSMHVAALKSVAMVAGSPRAEVYRLYMGQAYVIPGCRVTQTAYDNYLAGTIHLYNPSYSWQAPENANCFVLVYFISETPYSNEVMIPVIVDKVIK